MSTINFSFPTRRLIRSDGTTLEIDGPHTLDEIKRLIGSGCDCVDSVMLADRVHVLIVDDLGIRKELPANKTATDIYLSRCAPGTRAVIRGNVVIVPDADFAPPALKRFYEDI